MKRVDLAFVRQARVVKKEWQLPLFVQTYYYPIHKVMQTGLAK
jgi:hypothetical protein